MCRSIAVGQLLLDRSRFWCWEILICTIERGFGGLRGRHLGNVVVGTLETKCEPERCRSNNRYIQDIDVAVESLQAWLVI